MNRRIRSRTYGGVRGREPKGSLLRDPLWVREYHCLRCGIKSDRNHNSAIVLKAAGMSALKACGAALI